MNLNDSHLEVVNVSIFFYFCIVGICIVFLIFLKATVLIVTAFLSRQVFHADPLFLFKFVIFFTTINLHCYCLPVLISYKKLFHIRELS